ncbi:hypothetical protein PHLGIDRAFT_128904 [Phlebiopsis gigantea 11061_1 CR5-6]|uniref:Uncharacterized protein n=1 Tax=Phlebiopsis gigantea (strain 11061_1 CR5-6) TaxID=745531 RepID=A0A0C3S8K7_PHLG1|nr:hypothetical protein PHLGIDRAFT_128904 [Phlebiopsis gigantea 11061_1 CR5-6]
MARMTPPEAAYIYAQQLLGRGHGLPLWHPEQTQAELGDVGFIHHGYFHPIFNIFRTRDDPINHQGVPDGFIPLQISPLFIRYNEQYLGPGPICASSISVDQGQVVANASGNALDINLSYSLRCSGRRGAVAYLGDWAKQEQIVRSRKVRDYVFANHESWYIFAKSLGWEVRRKDIILVSGCVKTSSWSGLAWSSASTRHSAALNVSVYGTAGAGFRFSHENDTGLTVDERHPLTPPASRIAGGPNRYCVFIKYYKVKHAGPGIRRSRTTPRASDVAVIDEDVVDVRCWPWTKPSFSSQLDIIRARGKWISRLLRGQLGNPETRFARRVQMLGMIPSHAGGSAQQQNGDNENEEDCNEAAEASNPSSSSDPLEDVLDYDLENSHAETAVAETEDVYEICRPLTDQSEDLSACLRSRRPEMILYPNGAAGTNAPWYAGVVGPNVSHPLPEAKISSLSQPVRRWGDRLRHRTDSHVTSSPPAGPVPKTPPHPSSNVTLRRTDSSTPVASCSRPDLRIEIFSATPAPSPFSTPTCTQVYGITLPPQLPATQHAIGDALAFVELGEHCPPPFPFGPRPLNSAALPTHIPAGYLGA